MCKSETFVLVLLLISTVHGNIVKQISVNLKRVYDYMLTNHNLLNIDSIFGVVLSQASLAEVNRNAIDDLQKLHELIAKGGLIISKTLSKFDAGPMESERFVFDPMHWQRGIVFKSGLLDASYMRGLEDIKIQDYMLALNHELINGSISDRCLKEILQGPEPSTNACQISPFCRKMMVDDPDFGSGYSATHRILYLQIGRISGCKMDESKIYKYCSKVLLETRQIHRLGLTTSLLDLLFEQVTLCALEGFEEFMQNQTLEAAMLSQKDDGCYGFVTGDRLRAKRSANIISGNCVDHTTGLGASTLSLFLKYHTQKQLM